MAKVIFTKNKNHIQAILFDLDGVLIDSYRVWYHLFNDALEYFGFSRINQEVFQRHWGESTEQDVRIFMPGKTVKEVKKYFLDNYERYVSHLVINPGVHIVLKKLKEKNLKLGCVTNSHRDIVEKIIRTHDLSSYFQVVVTADDVIHPKPSPDMLYQAWEILGVAPSETVFIGDTEIDIQAGKHAGCMVIGYQTDAPMEIHALNELLDLIR